MFEKFKSAVKANMISDTTIKKNVKEIIASQLGIYVDQVLLNRNLAEDLGCGEYTYGNIIAIIEDSMNVDLDDIKDRAGDITVDELVETIVMNL